LTTSADGSENEESGHIQERGLKQVGPGGKQSKLLSANDVARMEAQEEIMKKVDLVLNDARETSRNSREQKKFEEALESVRDGEEQHPWNIPLPDQIGILRDIIDGNIDVVIQKRGERRSAKFNVPTTVYLNETKDGRRGGATLYVVGAKDYPLPTKGGQLSPSRILLTETVEPSRHVGLHSTERLSNWLLNNGHLTPEELYTENAPYGPMTAKGSAVQADIDAGRPGSDTFSDDKLKAAQNHRREAIDRILNKFADVGKQNVDTKVRTISEAYYAWQDAFQKHGGNQNAEQELIKALVDFVHH
jgi:hypothetical protein